MEPQPHACMRALDTGAQDFEGYIAEVMWLRLWAMSRNEACRWDCGPHAVCVCGVCVASTAIKSEDAAAAAGHVLDALESSNAPNDSINGNGNSILDGIKCTPPCTPQCKHLWGRLVLHVLPIVLCITFAFGSCVFTFTRVNRRNW